MSELSTNQLKAIGLLMEGKSHAAVRKELGVDRRTLYNWLHDEDFIAERDRRVEDMFSSIGGMHRLALDKAFRNALAELDSEDAETRSAATKMMIGKTQPVNTIGDRAATKSVVDALPKRLRIRFIEPDGSLKSEAEIAPDGGED